MNKVTPQVEPEREQVYESTRTETMYQLLYVDEQVALLRSENPKPDTDFSHRIERRSSFDDAVEAGFFKHKPDSNVDMLGETDSDWAEVSYIGEQTSENLHNEGYNTTFDVQQAGDAELLMVDGLGAKGLENLKDFSL
jgi:ERCC4-type nuclease